MTACIPTNVLARAVLCRDSQWPLERDGEIPYLPMMTVAVAPAVVPVLEIVTMDLTRRGLVDAQQRFQHR